RERETPPSKGTNPRVKGKRRHRKGQIHARKGIIAIERDKYARERESSQLKIQIYNYFLYKSEKGLLFCTLF
ncbi:hypothetical protein, partial [Kurthia gibsonii]|uniref:hypothetical protein n=1 Tax=Kurthia gibsonii TaxID=33946 RepID=UPI0019814885